MFRESNWRSIAKTVSWRILATLTTSILVLVFTHQLDTALLIGGLEATAKMVLYFLHERLWDRVKLGRREIKPAVIWFTGLSGSGKRDVSAWVADELTRRRFKAEFLDGGSVRDILHDTGFTHPERDAHIRR